MTDIDRTTRDTLAKFIQDFRNEIKAQDSKKRKLRVNNP